MLNDKMRKYTTTIKNSYLYIICVFYQFFIITVLYSDEWSLEEQPIKSEWGLEKQAPKYEWGLEEQASKHNKSNSIILHYDGINWIRQRSGTNNWLRKTWSIDNNNIFAVGDNGTIFFHDGKKWNKQTSGTNTYC